MKNRTRRRLQNVAERDGVSPRIGELCDGCFCTSKSSEQPGGEGDHLKFANTVSLLTHPYVPPHYRLQYVRSLAHE